MANQSDYLPNLLGPVRIQDDGTVLVARAAWNFIGFDIDSNPDTGAIEFRIPAATSSTPGTFSAADKSKLDGMQPQGAAIVPAALEFDWEAAQIQRKTLAAGANVITFAHATSGKSVTISLIGAGSTVTWPAGIEWPGGTAPTQTASGKDVYTFVHDGDAIVGSVVQDVSAP